MTRRVRLGPPPDGGYQGSGIRSRRRKPAEMIRRVRLGPPPGGGGYGGTRLTGRPSVTLKFCLLVSDGILTAASDCD
jgi:hypothetical protein